MKKFLNKNMRFRTLLPEIIRISLHAIKVHLLRTILTVLIIAVGITALIGILTAIDSIKTSITREFNFMGANTFSITGSGVRVEGNRRARKLNLPYISYYQANEFKENYFFPSTVSVSVYASGGATVKYGTEKTNPNVTIRGIDENYLFASGYEIESGRDFGEFDIVSGRNIVLLGEDVIQKIFNEDEDPLNKEIIIGGGKYEIVGLLKSKGSGFGLAGDNVCFIPYTNVRKNVSQPNMNYNILIRVSNAAIMDYAIGEAEAVFRTIRGLTPLDESDFGIEKSDNIVNILLDNIKNITLVTTIIGLITLMGAAIGLMNIMLVSVSERTREIGIRKATGAKSSTIRQQFLIEAIIIGQIGGIVGIIVGIIIGNMVSMLIGNTFVVPWEWVLVGVTLCFAVGIGSGYYPAQKAARMDPIESLRYE